MSTEAQAKPSSPEVRAEARAWNAAYPEDVLVNFWLDEKAGAPTGSGRTYGPASVVDGVAVVYPATARALVPLSHVEAAAVQPAVIRCCHCPRLTRLSRANARNSGWRFYDGTTEGGKELHDVICNVCTGEVTPLVGPSDDEGAQIIAEGSIPAAGEVMYMAAVLNGDVPGVRVVTADGEVL